jgi:hypothetical protein
VRHGLLLAGLNRADAEAAWKLSDEVAALRRAWFAETPQLREEWLLRLVRDALSALTRALDSMAAQLPEREGSSDGSLALGGAWDGIALRSAGDMPTPHPRTSARLTGAFAGLSPRTAEAAWRLLLRRREVAVPGRLLALLADCPPEHAEVCARRADLLARHRRFLADRGGGYASIAIGPLTNVA